MIRWWSSISYVGNWDITDGKETNKTSFERIDCKPKSQIEMFCNSILNVNTGEINNGNQLDSLVITRNGNLIRRYDYKNKKGSSSLLIEMIGKENIFYVVHPSTLNSTFVKLFFLNQPEDNIFTLVNDKYPTYRVFKLNN